MNTWPPPPPPRPPSPLPGQPPHTPWQPEPAPRREQHTSTVVNVGGSDWLAERLLEHRIVSLSGRLATEAATQAAASLALLDASGDEPVSLRLSDLVLGGEEELDTALTLLDTLDLVTVPVHATCLGELAGAAVVLLAVADHRTAGANAMVRLREPRARAGGPATEVATHAEQQQRQLRTLQQRLAEACGREVDTVAEDMRGGRVLGAEQARDYGLVDAVTAPHRAR